MLIRSMHALVVSAKVDITDKTWLCKAFLCEREKAWQTHEGHHVNWALVAYYVCDECVLKLITHNYCLFIKKELVRTLGPTQWYN